jgi:hypothetical protein
MLKSFYSCLNYPFSVFFVCFNYLKSLKSHVFVYNLAFKFLAIFFVPHACADVFPRCWLKIFIKLSSCFMHFDGVTEQLCKVTGQRLKKFLECRSKWAKLKCKQAEIANKSYENIDDGSVKLFIHGELLQEKNPDSINLEWYHHMKR